MLFYRSGILIFLCIYFIFIYSFPKNSVLLFIIVFITFSNLSLLSYNGIYIRLKHVIASINLLVSVLLSIVNSLYLFLDEFNDPNPSTGTLVYPVQNLKNVNNSLFSKLLKISQKSFINFEFIKSYFMLRVKVTFVNSIVSPIFDF